MQFLKCPRNSWDEGILGNPQELPVGSYCRNFGSMAAIKAGNTCTRTVVPTVLKTDQCWYEAGRLKPEYEVFAVRMGSNLLYFCQNLQHCA